MSYQKTIIIGNLGNQPEMRYTPSGQAVTSFSVAVNEQYKNATGENVKRTIWFRVSTWGRQAESCNEYLKKGSLVLVEGQLAADPATGGPKLFQKRDGSLGAANEIRATIIKFLGGRTADSASEHPAAVETPSEDNLPF